MDPRFQDPQARVVAGTAVAALLLFSGVRGALVETGRPEFVEFVAGVATGGALLLVSWFAVRALFRVLQQIAIAWVVLALAVLGVLWAQDLDGMTGLWRLVHWHDARSEVLSLPGLLSVPALAVLLAVPSLLAACVLHLRAGRRNERALFATTGVALVLSVGIVVGLVDDGADPFPTAFRTNTPDALADVVPIPLEDPSAPGAYDVNLFAYGAGDNPRRAEFGADRDFESRTVDARALLPEWKGIRGETREDYWGFDLSEAPLNGLVWAPRAEGRFPLVLIVHGNHGMTDVSDPGYAYLGALLASRGHLVVSVDENYVNGAWSGDFRGREMALRGWLLLEHLSLWRDWAATPGHALGALVDLDRIALVGHSRGGEAVAIAEAFDGLTHHPDDATVAFDYGFDIDALVAIAQVDQRYHRRVELEDVHFLALQGSYDADEPAFHGLRQFNRIALSPSSDHFKAGLYVHRGNHGQFNSGWGRHDYGPPGAWLLNTAPILPAEDQRRFAEVAISAFLDATLKDRRGYRRFFRAPRSGGDWLPEGIYLHQYQDASFRVLASFEEDLDVTTGAAAGARIETEDLTLWREEDLEHRDGRLQGTNVAVLGWHAGASPLWRLTLPDGIDAPADAVLAFALTASPERAPDGDDGDDEGSEDEAEDAADDDAGPRVRIELVGRDGRVQGVDAASFARLAPPLRVRYLKSEAANADRYENDWEAVLQTVEVPLDRFALAPAEVREIVLRFDGSAAGTVLLDEVGVRAGP